jgi:hypothetical protein
VIFIVLSSIETVHDTVQYRYCIFIVLSSLETVHDAVQYRYCIFIVLSSLETVHDAVLCVIYQLNFMDVTRISLYIMLYKYITFGIIRCFT